jgi:hypothetical protein
VWSAASSRVKGTYPIPSYFWVDEFQNYVTPEFVDILAEARGFGLGLNLATQYYGRLPTWMQQAVLTNCRTKVTGTVDSPDEARLMTRIFGVPEEQVRSLEAFTYLARMSADRRASDSFTLFGLPPVGKGDGRLDVDKLRQAFAHANDEQLPSPQAHGGIPMDFFEQVQDFSSVGRATWERHQAALGEQDLQARARYLADLSEAEWQEYRRLRRQADKETYLDVADHPERFEGKADWIRVLSSLQVEVPRDEIEAERMRLEAATQAATDVFDDLLF